MNKCEGVKKIFFVPTKLMQKNLIMLKTNTNFTKVCVSVFKNDIGQKELTTEMYFLGNEYSCGQLCTKSTKKRTIHGGKAQVYILKIYKNNVRRGNIALPGDFGGGATRYAPALNYFPWCRSL